MVWNEKSSKQEPKIYLLDPRVDFFNNRSDVSHKINRLHERRFRALLNDETLTFNDMLSKGNDTTI